MSEPVPFQPVLRRLSDAVINRIAAGEVIDAEISQKGCTSG
ncbi:MULTISPECIES: hypothetical protein [Komagataeibacter]|uniref:Uncharacterized protein n=1 Tax=Komagataeibacter intermedius NRIC 0521 TaxID=1307934 RepID=A0ABQ0PKI9_9PROT|nr:MULTISPECIES: hypothetical protein [Komagataeibacter]GAN88602.1 hypothetical protein Gain_0274_004 [Komagataeibacter intermedius TF2]GBQ41856.1 hypothetical protein AA0614_2466 [Komagataeibacter saccharivorans NRIC 0614]GBQ74092.1 hypothetical protein AA0521_2465 [Komagataeibacter intermedius NRIC 0521]